MISCSAIMFLVWHHRHVLKGVVLDMCITFIVIIHGAFINVIRPGVGMYRTQVPETSVGFPPCLNTEIVKAIPPQLPIPYHHKRRLLYGFASRFGSIPASFFMSSLICFLRAALLRRSRESGVDSRDSSADFLGSEIPCW